MFLSIIFIVSLHSAAHHKADTRPMNKHALRSPLMFQGLTTKNRQVYKSLAAKLSQIIPDPLDSGVINISGSFFPETYKPADVVTRKDAAASSRTETASAADFFGLEKGFHPEKFPEIVTSKSFATSWASKKWRPHREQIV